nr:BURP domain-containing protein 4-like isoform X1 [Lolium perenne]
MGAKVLAIAFVLLLLTFEKNAFTMAADPGTRNDRAEPPPSQENGFDASSYAEHWGRNPSASEKNGFDASSYAEHWGRNPSASEENGFDASSYAEHWGRNPSASGSLVPGAQTRHWHIKVKTGMLFLKKILHVGTILPEGTMFARADMPKPDSSVSTPLEPKYFATIVSRFKIPYNSLKAKQVAETLRSCVKPIDREEPHVCTSSRKAMSRFATTSLGSNLTQAAFTRIHGHESPTTRYVVAQIAQLSNHTVACHPMDFPYEVFYCHRPKEVQALRVQLNDMKNGMTRVTATVMCHMNTSNWDKEYFELLGGERGEPVCHYMPQNYIMFY